MRIALIGYGKMGKAIEQLAIERKHEIILKIDIDNAKKIFSKDLIRADVAIEFSTPATAYKNILKCFEARIPVVVGTTGWLDKYDKIKKKCLDNGQTLFYASNFSIGMNLVFKLNKQLADWMNKYSQYDVSIDETHHTQKADKPSGTAITLANDIISKLDRKSKWVNAKADKPEALSILSYRKENVPGIHTIKYKSSLDNIEIKHTAYYREGFALGAVLAAEWLKGKTGIYTIADLLNE